MGPKSVDLEINSKNYKHENGKSWPQVSAIFTVSLASISSGLLWVWSSPFTLKITKDKENYDITEEEASYFIVFHPVGMIFASIVFFKIPEMIGRKKFVLLLALPQLGSWILIAVAKTKWEFYAARFLSGIGDSFLFCSIPPYVGEISVPAVRGYWGNIPTSFNYGGQLLITILGSYLDVRPTAYICMVLPVIFLVLVLLLPESPYQLIRDHKYDEARKSIKWLQRKSDVEFDFQNMKADVESQMSEGGTWKDLFTSVNNTKALRAGAFLRLSQQLCGITVLVTYTQPIFDKAGGSLNPQYSSMIFIGIIFVLNSFSSLPVEKFGRRPSYFYSLLSSGIIHLILALFFYLDEFQLAYLEDVKWFPLVGLVAFVLTFSFGLGVVPTLMLSELFSASIKSKGLSVLMTFFGTGGFLATIIFNLLLANLGLYGPFLIYGISCLLSTILTLRWVPETKGKTLEEIQQSLRK